MWMKRYVEQLIDDLEVTFGNAQEKLSLFFNSSNSSDYFPITDDDEGGVLISDLIGMEKFVFPKISYLSDCEAKELTGVMVKVFNAYGLNPIFGEAIPEKIRYGQLREYVSQVVYPVDGTLVDLEMCDYLPADCPFAATCPAVELTRNCCEDKKKRA